MVHDLNHRFNQTIRCVESLYFVLSDIKSLNQMISNHSNPPNPCTISFHSTSFHRKSPGKQSSNANSSRRGVKRKHQGMDEETLRKRACKLAKHKYLATLYKTLVGKKVLTAAEFWEEYGKDIDVRHSQRGLVTGMSNTVLNKTMERDNMWSLYQLFMDDIAQQQAQQNENDDGEPKKLKINLTAEHILEIFIHLPEVKLAYEQNVPCRFTEKEFWTMFLQSHYFKRKRKKDVTSSISEKETEMDKLLKKYTKELAEQQNVSQREKSGSPVARNTMNGVNGYHANHSNGFGGGEGVNSFSSQIERIQRAKNEEVDVAGKLKRYSIDHFDD